MTLGKGPRSANRPRVESDHAHVIETPPVGGAPGPSAPSIGRASRGGHRDPEERGARLNALRAGGPARASTASGASPIVTSVSMPSERAGRRAQAGSITHETAWHCKNKMPRYSEFAEISWLPTVRLDCSIDGMEARARYVCIAYAARCPNQPAISSGVTSCKAEANAA